MIDIEKSLKAYKPKTAKNEAIKAHAGTIAKALKAAGVTDQASLYNARGNLSLPFGVDVFEVVAYLDGEMANEHAEKAAPKAAAKE